MATEIVTVKRVYLKDKRFWKSAYHTAHIAPPGLSPRDAKDQVPLSVVFHMGIARDVPQNIYDALAAAGIATTERPQLRIQEEDL